MELELTGGLDPVGHVLDRALHVLGVSGGVQHDTGRVPDRRERPVHSSHVPFEVGHPPLRVEGAQPLLVGVPVLPQIDDAERRHSSGVCGAYQFGHPAVQPQETPVHVHPIQGYSRAFPEIMELSLSPGQVGMEPGVVVLVVGHPTIAPDRHRPCRQSRHCRE